MATKKKYSYEYPRPALTVDAVVFGLDLAAAAPALEILLIERADKPFKGRWALPGGFVNVNESADKAVRRELAEECAVSNVFLEQLYTFSEPGRDPREHVVSVAYYSLVDLTQHRPMPGSDASKARWFSVETALKGKLAFDHTEIIEKAMTRLRGKLRYAPIGFELLPKTFSLGQLQQLYEVILGRKLDKAHFRRKVAEFDVLVETGREEDVSHRPAALYRFDRAKYETLTLKGLNFEL